MTTVTEELNRKILTPELSEEQKKELHKELSRLYNSYCDPSANDKISFDKDVIESLRQSKYSVSVINFVRFSSNL